MTTKTGIEFKHEPGARHFLCYGTKRPSDHDNEPIKVIVDYDSLIPWNKTNAFDGMMFDSIVVPMIANATVFFDALQFVNETFEQMNQDDHAHIMSDELHDAWDMVKRALAKV